MKIIITEKEVENTKEIILHDPCEHIMCADFDCDHCPLQEYAQSLRRAQDKFIDVLNSIPTEGAE